MELSMEWQTILLIAGTLICYTLVTLVIPSIVFGPRLIKLPFALRMMGYYCIGNTIILYVVFALEFLHISYAPTLFLLTLIVYAYFFLHVRGSSFHQFFVELHATANQLSNRTITIRTIRARRKPQREAFKAGARRIFVEVFLSHIIEWILLGLLIAYGLWLIGSENIQEFGYHASDGTVHTRWINGLVLNEPFIDGVYPFGFHVIIYYLHELFGFRIMDQVRIFGLVTLVYLILNMCAFMKSIFRHRFLPELGCFIFLGFNVFHEYATWRYLAALPQENAFVFLFPSIAFAIAYFHYKHERGKLESLSPIEAEQLQNKDQKESVKERLSRAEKKNARLEAKKRAAEEKEAKKAARFEKKKERIKSTRFAGAKSERERREFEKLAKKIAKEKGKQPEKPGKEKRAWYKRIWDGYLHFSRWINVSLGREDTLCMFLFALAFAMTIAVHFYATVIAVFLYFAIAFGYGVRFFRPRYFIPILKAIFLGLVISILPFLVALALGNRLQGSLMWAVSVMQPAPEVSVEETIEEATEDESGSEVEDEIEDGDDSGVSSDVTSGDEDESKEDPSKGFKFIIRRPAFLDRWIYRFHAIKSSADNILGYYVEWWMNENSFPMAEVFYAMLLVLLVSAVILFIPLREYAMTLLSMFFGEIFILLILLGSGAGLPSIMENYRVIVFFVPLIGIGAALGADAVITIVLDWLHWKYVRWVSHFAALAVCVLCVFVMYREDYIRQASFFMERYSALSLNGAITCTSRILSENPKWTFTILSTVDEVEMTNLYGYHYEDIVLLHKLQKVNTDGSVSDDDFNIFQDDPEDPNDPNTYIPTKYVYIYLEKQPVGSSTDYYDEDWPTSSDGAKYRVPPGSSVYNYYNANRWVVMSHLYMWTRKLLRIYPEALSVYYEDSEFICYRLSQGSIPYNLGIDYGYNDAQEELILGDQ